MEYGQTVTLMHAEQPLAKVGSIPLATKRIEETAQELEAALASLTSRLTYVVRPEVATTAADKHKPTVGIGCEYEGQLQRIADNLARMSDDVRSVTNRLEL